MSDDFSEYVDEIIIKPSCHHHIAADELKTMTPEPMN